MDENASTPIATILHGQTDAPPAATPAEQQTDEGQGRDERGRFAPRTPPAEAGDAPPLAAPPAAEPQQKPAVPEGYAPVAALIDHRMKVREVERERDELRRRLQAIEQQKQAAPPVDFFADPEVALNQRLAPIQQMVDQRYSAMRFRASRAEALAEFGKPAIDELERAVDEAVEAGDPEIAVLQQQMQASDHPVGVAMQWFQRRKVLSEVGTDPAAYREKLKAELLAELQAAPPAAAPVMPSNLAGARNVGARSGPAWSGPTPLADIFKR